MIPGKILGSVLTFVSRLCASSSLSWMRASFNYSNMRHRISSSSTSKATSSRKFPSLMSWRDCEDLLNHSPLAIKSLSRRQLFQRRRRSGKGRRVIGGRGGMMHLLSLARWARLECIRWRSWRCRCLALAYLAPSTNRPRTIRNALIIPLLLALMSHSIHPCLERLFIATSLATTVRDMLRSSLLSSTRYFCIRLRR